MTTQFQSNLSCWQYLPCVSLGIKSFVVHVPPNSNWFLTTSLALQNCWLTTPCCLVPKFNFKVWRCYNKAHTSIKHWAEEEYCLLGCDIVYPATDLGQMFNGDHTWAFHCKMTFNPSVSLNLLSCDLDYATSFVLQPHKWEIKTCVKLAAVLFWDFMQYRAVIPHQHYI